MAKVLIVGAGGVGQVVTHKCAQVPEVFSEIVLASRTEEKCKRIAAQIKRPIKTAQVDADDVRQMSALIEREKPAIVINVALPYQDLPIMDACLATGVDYLDTANYEPRDTAKFEYSWQWAYQDRYRSAASWRCSARLRPGRDQRVHRVPAKHHFDTIEELDIIDCNAGDRTSRSRPTSTPRSTSARSPRPERTGRRRVADHRAARGEPDVRLSRGHRPEEDLPPLSRGARVDRPGHFPTLRRARSG